MSGEHVGWRAGAASTTFPVAIGTPLAGYMARTGPAIGVFDELTVGALLLRHEERTLAIVAVDTGLAQEVATAAGLDRSEIVLCASHTHSGPAGVVARLHPADTDRGAPALRAAFVAACAAAIGEARGRLEAVDLLFGTSETSGLAANRNDRSGPFDPRLSILATRRLGGEVGAVLVHFACHPTILGADNRFVSADFPGALRRSLRASWERDGRAPVILFANGAAGDVSTRFTRRAQDVAEVERVGAGLATAAVAALAGARSVDGPIRYDRQRVPLPPRPLVEPALSSLADLMMDPGSDRLSAPERRRAETRAQGAALLARLVEAGPQAIRAALDVEAWALGDVVLVAVPGELFASLGARIAAASPSPALVLGYANGYVGYLVDEAAHAAGTYEALASPFAPGAGERVGEAARVLAHRVRMGSVIGSGYARSPPTPAGRLPRRSG
jgi:Neutral/alkaline non-lysosomal ceramidase, N-terminal